MVKKNLPANAGEMGSNPGLERAPGEGNGNPFQYSCLENSMDREAWWATVHGVTKNWIQLSDYFFHFMIPQCPIAPKWGRHDLNPGSSASIASVFGV